MEETEDNQDLKTVSRSRLAVFVFYFCQGLCFSSWASRIPDIKSSLGLNDAAWGTILLMIPVGQICGMSLSGFLVSRIGSKNILPFTAAAYALTLIVIGLCRTEYALMMSLIVFGFFGNFCNISVNTQGVNVEAKYNKPIMASFHGGWSAAGFAGSMIGLLMVNLGLIPLFHFIIIAILVIFAEVRNVKYLSIDIKKKKNREENGERHKNKPEMFLYLLGVVAFFGMAAEGAMTDWNGLYYKTIVGAPEKMVPLALASYMVAMASCRFISDKATQKWGRLRVVQASGLLIFIGLSTAVIFPNIIITPIAFMIVGLGTASIVPTIYSIAGQKTSIATGMALTIVSSISFLGFLMGPPVIGYISEATNLRWSYALIAIFGVCIVALSSNIRVFKEKKQ
ncbi:MAG: MFS transporter [Dysgonomonas sp.]